MRRDQALFLIVGIVIGLVAGLVFGVIGTRPDLIGLAPKQAAAEAPAQGMPPQGMPAGQPGAMPQGADPHAMSGVAGAMNELRQRLDKNPNDADALVSLGEMFLQANMRDRALEPLEHAAHLVAGNPQLATRAAQALGSAGDFPKALEVARQAMKDDPAAPGPAEIATRVSVTLVDPASATSALEEFKRRAAKLPNAQQIVDQLTANVTRMRNTVQAAHDKPNDYGAQVTAGNTYYDGGRWDEAVAAYKRALALNGDDPNVITDYGFALAQQNKPQEALAQFEVALKKNPSFANAALNGVIISASTGDKTRARAWLDRLKQIAPQHPAIQQLEEQLK